MACPIEVKEKAISLRRKGYSIKEIAAELAIAQSTSSLWLQNIKLNSKAKERLKRRRVFGQYKTQQTKKRKKKILLAKYRKNASRKLEAIKLDQNLYQLTSAIFLWCEGAKRLTCIEFFNSDPTMIKTFTQLLRLSFDLDEKKFRILMHLHEYHDEKKQKNFWSKITKIPESQFTKTYWKPHTKKRKRENYPGCIRVSYYDVHIARQLYAWYNVFARKLGGVR